MPKIRRRTAIISTYLVFFISLGLSALYLYNFVVDFYSEMETKLGELNGLIVRLQSIEKELIELENFKKKVSESPRFDITRELPASEIANILVEILRSKIVELNYLMISCETPEPITFENRETTYKVILRTGGSVSGAED